MRTLLLGKRASGKLERGVFTSIKVAKAVVLLPHKTLTAFALTGKERGRQNMMWNAREGRKQSKIRWFAALKTATFQDRFGGEYGQMGGI